MRQYSQISYSKICIFLGPSDCDEPRALFPSSNTLRKLVWRAKILLAIVDGHGTFDSMHP